MAIKVTKTETNRPAGDNYRLEVADFGPIAKASMDLRPLTVFIGPSNTGKSYLAVLLYALHRSLGGTDSYYYEPGFPRRRRLSFGFSAIDSPQTRASIWKSLRSWALKRTEDRMQLPLPDDVGKHIRLILESGAGLKQGLKREIRRCFGVDNLEELVRRAGSSTRAHVTLSIPQQTSSRDLEYTFELGRDNIEISGRIADIPSPLAELRRSKYMDRVIYGLDRFVSDEKIDDFDLNIWFESLAEIIYSHLLQPLCRNAYYLPADRTGVMHSHQVVVGTLVQSATTAGLRPSTNVPMLSGVLADFLNQLINISGMRKRPYRKVSPGPARSIEENILKGKVKMEDVGAGYPTFTYRPDGWTDDLPLMRTSSMVSELAPVVLYLRHLAVPGDVLIIEEPEAHLHPGMQATFARELARLVRSGFRIIVTTHSEWFLEQVGNLMRLSELPESKRGGIRDAEIVLRPEEVGAWLFKPNKRPKGSIVEEVVLDSDTGLFPTDYDEVSESLYNESAAIFNRLQG